MRDNKLRDKPQQSIPVHGHPSGTPSPHSSPAPKARPPDGPVKGSVDFSLYGYQPYQHHYIPQEKLSMVGSKENQKCSSSRYHESQQPGSAVPLQGHPIHVRDPQSLSVNVSSPPSPHPHPSQYRKSNTPQQHGSITLGTSAARPSHHMSPGPQRQLPHSQGHPPQGNSSHYPTSDQGHSSYSPPGHPSQVHRGHGTSPQRQPSGSQQHQGYPSNHSPRNSQLPLTVGQPAHISNILQGMVPNPAYLQTGHSAVGASNTSSMTVYSTNRTTADSNTSSIHPAKCSPIMAPLELTQANKKSKLNTGSRPNTFIDSFGSLVENTVLNEFKQKTEQESNPASTQDQSSCSLTTTNPDVGGFPGVPQAETPVPAPSITEVMHRVINGSLADNDSDSIPSSPVHRQTNVRASPSTVGNCNPTKLGKKAWLQRYSTQPDDCNSNCSNSSVGSSVKKDPTSPTPVKIESISEENSMSEAESQVSTPNYPHYMGVAIILW